MDCLARKVQEEEGSKFISRSELQQPLKNDKQGRFWRGWQKYPSSMYSVTLVSDKEFTRSKVGIVGAHK